jgi:hypothetical protein
MNDPQYAWSLPRLLMGAGAILIIIILIVVFIL